MKRSKARTILLLGILVLATTFPMIAVAAPAKKSAPPPLVSVIRVTEQNVHPTVDYVGRVEALQTVDLQARVSGVLEQILFKEGSDVRAGDLLYVIEQDPYRVRVAANKAREAKSLAALKKAMQHLQRIRTVRTGGIPVTDIEAAEAAEQQAQAELQEAQALLRLSEIDHEYTRIYAPIDGRIGATALTKGNMCGPTSGTLARIVQLDPIRVLFSISENDLAAVKATQTDAANKQIGGSTLPRLKLADGSLLENSGRIDFVDNQIDPKTGTVAVRALFDNPDAVLLPGQYVTLVTGQSRTNLLPVIPQSAVLEDRDGRYVLVVDEQDKVEQRRIMTGALVGSLWAVETGLTAGEVVIVQGVQKVRPGQLVKTMFADAAKKD
ncbi:MAG: efflux RND transporter periplasmic adaptor subunit [Deltaproteobacteria bacterium]|nr:efflux RND transporter periplasmic adaptor subunit [Deltaproteobacteria bacterium]